MKYVYEGGYHVSQRVAPFTGAWIEIWLRRKSSKQRMVAPFTGAWIEIIDPLAFVSMHYVAPFTGAWI